MAAAMAMREADAGHTSGTNAANSGEAHMQRHGRQALRQPYKYIELLGFEMEDMTILQTKRF